MLNCHIEVWFPNFWTKLSLIALVSKGDAKTVVELFIGGNSPSKIVLAWPFDMGSLVYLLVCNKLMWSTLIQKEGR